MVLLGVLAFVFVPPVLSDDCAEGVVRSDGECVGVTDGSHIFAPDLADVEKLIETENDDVTKRGSRQSVSIAYVFPLRTGETNISVTQPIRRDLEGAFIAQYSANHDTASERPLIRLLLANTGADGHKWQPVVDALSKRVAGKDHLVATVGFGPSLDTTRDAIRWLEGKGIPRISATMTADDLTEIPTLRRIAPLNHAEVTAVIGHARKASGRALLVQDMKAIDPYPRTLGDTFRDRYPDSANHLVGQVEQYNSDLGAVATTFTQMLPNICSGHPGVIYFAGRSDQLKDFLKVLARRNCGSDHITVLTGDDATGLDGESSLDQALAANISVMFTALAHPGAWALPDTGSFFNRTTVARFRDPAGIFRRNFPNESLDDGEIIMSHDAVLVAVTAIRNAASPERPQVTSKEVEQALNRLHGEQKVAGASGYLSFDNTGSPTGKPIPLVELTPGGVLAFRGLLPPAA
ncbi:ABC transporter substrate-binding protein [Protofrankia coriariae]|uniref:ABC transporter substrate-binding protein n=1 Tax=Protofrankia coriariae TaxID=1562887 RepID=UPI0012F63CA9|nr:ABC transporter substrate-binding protein [Protofrankia coriariae]